MTGRDELDSFRRETANKLRDVRCPRHKRAPRVCFTGSSLRDVTIRMSGCCGTLMHLANDAIAGRRSSAGAEESLPRRDIG